MLIDEDRIAVGVGEHEVRRAGGGFIGGGVGGQAAGFEGFLQVTDIVKVRQRDFGAVPAGVEGQHVPLEHALEEADLGGLILEDDPVLDWSPETILKPSFS